MPLIIPANTLSGGYEVANSCRLDGTSAYLSDTLGTPTNNKIYTFSCWVKRAKLGQYSVMFNAGSSRDCLRFRGDNDRLHFFTGEATTAGLATNRVFRDTSAWYHIVCAVNTTLSESSRVKLYVNGTQETSFAVTNYPAEDYTNVINSAVEHRIGKASNVYDEYFGGYIAEVVFIDGQQLTPSSFSEFDEDTPTVLKPKDVSGLTFGNNGFYLNMSSSSELGTDTSGNSNTFAETNLDATDQAQDTPTNNWCVMNAVGSHGSVTLAEGNIQVNVANNTDNASGTFFVDKGKWYVELKYTAQSSSDDLIMFGIRPDTMNIYQDNLFNLTGTGQGLYYYGDSGNQRPANTSYGSAVALNDILGVYIDLDNNKLYFAINGTIQASGTGISIPTTSDYYTFSFTSGGQSDTAQVNFGGCPTYTIASGNSDANNLGNFEYDPSAGTFDGASKDFYALCTKNLAEFG